MQYFVTTDALETHKTDCLAIAVFEEAELSVSAQIINEISGDVISNLFKTSDITGTLGQTMMLYNIHGIRSVRILLVGCGKKDEITENNFNSAVTLMANIINESGATKATSCLTEMIVNGKTNIWNVRQSVISTEVALYKYSLTKKDPKYHKKPMEHLGFIANTKNHDDFELAATMGQSIGNGMNLARELGDLPGNICTPSYLADKAVEMDRLFNTVTTSILEEIDMEKLGMGSLLSVSRGSYQPAKLITMRYKGLGNDERPVVLVGKGLTFDSGGISLKSCQGMDEMKYDMCGSASIFGTILAIAELNLPINVVGIIPSSENMPDGNANKPGDVITSMSGRTIEILNTDAEGRLILCDALTYSERFNPAVVIDIATLTGAIIVALGSHATGLLSNNQNLANDLLQAGTDIHDRAWQLPLWNDYQKQLDSNFADIANVGGKEAGSITAAYFLSYFTNKFDWAHLDIAGTAWNSGTNKGATGRPVPMLVQFLLNRVDAKV
ncbi:MAG: leucyl aminopeptidase [Piscirickettsiaceae bacterium]|nr:leucyl aminopeptidase [Piscirickettsiaceae bacterium]